MTIAVNPEISGGGSGGAQWSDSTGTALVREDLSTAPVASAAAHLFQSTGTGDDRATLQVLVDSISSAGGGTVYFDGTITINSKHPTQTCGIYWPANVGMQGFDQATSTLVAGSSFPVNSALVETVTGAGWYRFENFTIDGAKSRLSSGDIGKQEDEGINIKGGTRATIRNMRIINCGADAIDIDACDNVFIIGNRFEDNGGNGVHAVGSTGDNYVIAHNISSGNSFERSVNADPAAAADACAIDVGGSKAQCIILGNVSNGDVRGIRVDNAQRTVVQGNVIKFFGGVTPTEGITIKSGAGQCIVNSNVVRASSGAAGVCVSVTGGVGVNISGNNLYSSLTGVEVNGAQRLSIKNNTTESCGNGVNIIACSGRYDVCGNTFVACNSGVRTVSANGSIIGNTVVQPNSIGIDVRAAVSNVTVHGNVVDGGASWGVRLLNSPTNCTVTDNECPGCASGTLQTTGSGHHIRNRGAGTPESAIHAGPGSQWYRTDGGAATSFYVKETGTGNTGWVPK